VPKREDARPDRREASFSWKEATYLFGILILEESEKTKEDEFKPVFFYNQSGNRDKKLAEGSLFKLGERVLKPYSKTLGSEGPRGMEGVLGH
jgi:hypothetical protein